jgi:TfoX/Sxy family transcriptional regulator of competence genes
MPYDEWLAERVRALLSKKQGWSERKLFGGIAFMLNGNMCAGVVKGDLMVRVGPDAHDDALAQPGARPMDFTGRPMRGMVFVGPAGYRADDALAAWVRRGVAYAKTLPAK